ncbi:MAG TPA: hypothetical protein GX497_14345 [Bacillus bacterium]|nr:hypothetical protein [Bacillus sp. (in: firmicutes)]
MEQSLSNLDDIEDGEQLETNRELELKYHTLENLLRKLMIDQELKNKNVSWELYHVVAQTLFSILLGIRMTINEDVDEILKNYLKKLEISTSEVLNIVKRLSSDLYPQVIEEIGFVAVLISYINSLKEDGINIKLQINGEKKQVHSDKDLLFYRIAEEIIRFVVHELKKDRMKLILSFENGTENKFLFSFQCSQNEIDQQTIENGLEITKKRLEDVDGWSYIQRKKEEMDKWLIEIYIP